MHYLVYELKNDDLIKKGADSIGVTEGRHEVNCITQLNNILTAGSTYDQLIFHQDLYYSCYDYSYDYSEDEHFNDPYDRRKFVVFFRRTKQIFCRIFFYNTMDEAAIKVAKLTGSNIIKIEV
jgi:hypothetical protein